MRKPKGLGDDGYRGRKLCPPGSAAGAQRAVDGAVFGTVNLPCIVTWAIGGTAMGRILSDDRRRRIVSGVLGLLLLWTVYLINT